MCLRQNTPAITATKPKALKALKIVAIPSQCAARLEELRVAVSACWEAEAVCSSDATTHYHIAAAAGTLYHYDFICTAGPEEHQINTNTATTKKKR